MEELNLTAEQENAIVEKAKKRWNEFAKEVGVDKFKSAEELAKAYKELESKPGKSLKDLKDEEFLGAVKETFAGIEDESSLSEKEQKELSISVGKELGLPARITDKIVSAAAKSLVGDKIAAQEEQLQRFLKDPTNKKNLERAVSKRSKEEISAFEERYKSGAVTLEEAKLLASMGEPAPEENTSLDLGEEGGKGGGDQADLDELMDIINNKASIWTNKHHPQFQQVTERKEELKKKLDV